MEGATAGVAAVLPKVACHCAVPVAAGGVRAAIVCRWDRHPPASQLQFIIHSEPTVMHRPLKWYTCTKQSFGHGTPPSQAHSPPIRNIGKDGADYTQGDQERDAQVALAMPATSIT